MKIADAMDSIGIQHMTKVFIVDTSVQSNTTAFAFNLSTSALSDQLLDRIAVNQTQQVVQRLEDVLEMAQRFYHMAVLWKAEVA